VALDRPIDVTVHIELTGTAVGVKTQGGMLDFVTRELRVECLPADIPEKVVVDVTALELGKHLRVSDVTFPPKVKVLSEPGLVIVHIVAPKAEEAAETAEAAAETTEGAKAEPEVIKKGKTTTEEEASDEKGVKKEKK
jgi:large subunit ribosomal protein L25